MTSPALRKGGYYHFIDKARIATTNVTSTVDSVPGAWYAKMAGECAVGAMNELLEHPGLHWAMIMEDDRFEEDTRKYISNAARRYSQYAAEVGSAVHWCIEHDWFPGQQEHQMCERVSEYLDESARGGKQTHWDIIVKHEDNCDKVIAHILDHEHGYREFISDYSFEIIRREVTVYNSIHDYAGTLDVYGRSRGDLVLADYKTGKPKIDYRTKKLYPSVELQMQGYGHCDFLVDNGEYIPIEEFPDYALVVELTPRGYTPRKVEFTDAAFTAFLHIREYCRWEEER